MKVKLKSWRRPLRPCQRRALAKIEGVQHPALYMEMRTGKTLTLIRWAVRRRLQRCLVVAPVSVLEAWEKELNLEKEAYVVVHGLDPEKRLQRVKLAWEQGARRRTWLLTTYGTLRAMAKTYKGKLQKLPLVAGMPWDLVALDESTAVKNPQSLTSQIATKGFRKSKHRAVLSGLPDPEGELDLYCQFQFLHGSFLGKKNFWEFRNDFFDPGYGGYDYYPKKGARQTIKKAVHTKAFCLTREQAGISDGKVYETRRVEMTPAQRRLYKQVEEEWAAGARRTKFAVVKQKWMCQVASGFDPETRKVISTAKVDELVYLLKGELKRQKVVVWFSELAEVDLVSEKLAAAKIRFEVITGATPRPERTRRRLFFSQKTGASPQVLLATEKVAKFGIDCSASDCCIYYSNEWSCEDRTQSEDRIVSLDKKVDNLVIDLVTKDTIEEEVAEVVKDKKLSAKLFLTNLMQMFWGRGGSEGGLNGTGPEQAERGEDPAEYFGDQEAAGHSRASLPKRRRRRPEGYSSDPRGVRSRSDEAASHRPDPNCPLR